MKYIIYDTNKEIYSFANELPAGTEGRLDIIDLEAKTTRCVSSEQKTLGEFSAVEESEEDDDGLPEAEPVSESE